MANVAFNTLGCKVNQYETESMMAQFEAKGYNIVGFHEKADIYIVNTCTVTNMADKKSRQMLSKAKKSNTDALVVAVGCYVQAAQDALNEALNVDLLVGNTDKGRIVDVIEGYLESHLIPKVKDLAKYRTYDDMWLTHESGHTRVHIKIQDGCDQFCSYCIIPFARGRIRSRDSESILNEVKGLVENGYKEVVLSGIHLASYGVQFENYGLIDLLEDLDKIEGLSRVRLGSLEPTLITEAFTKRLGKLRTLCDHFHLSMQSGDDEVLASMNRKYTTKEYLKAVLLLKETLPGCGITTDLIVGFPGETDELFNNTLSFMASIGFMDVHVFKYSVRDGTKAALMTQQIDGSIKQGRSQKAMALAASMHHDFLRSFIGKTMDVLVEDKVSKEDKNYYVGHTKNYLKVFIPDQGENLLNQLKTVVLGELFKEGLKENLIEI